jgi:uncharacterized protein
MTGKNSLNSLDSGLEFKFAESKTGSQITGYASLFGEVDQGGDIVMPGAYTKSLAAGRSIKMLFQHRTDIPIGIWPSVKEDEKGLKVDGELCLDCTAGKDAAALIRMKAMTGLSIGYQTIKADKDPATGARRLHELDLWEISVVTFPMQMSAGITAMKSLEEIDSMDLSDIDYHLREAGGFSRAEVKRLLSRHASLVKAREAQITTKAQTLLALRDLREAVS